MFTMQNVTMSYREVAHERTQFLMTHLQISTIYYSGAELVDHSLGAVVHSVGVKSVRSGAYILVSAIELCNS